MGACLIGSQQSGRALLGSAGVFYSLSLDVLPFSRPINVLWLLSYSSILRWSRVPSWSEYK